jgi:hypothetical protein
VFKRSADVMPGSNAMRVDEAKAIAANWVHNEARTLPGFWGALLHGSILDLPDDALIAPGSDLDVLVVLDDPDAIAKPGKFRYRDLLLEVSLIARERVDAPEKVLGEYNIAPSFRVNGILADPTGGLSSVQAEVAAHFADPAWIEARIAQAVEKVRSGFQIVIEAPLHARVTGWLFSTGVLTHVLLVAALRNPTVRKRYVATRDLLAEHHRLDAYERLLDLLGCRDWTPERTSAHLATMTEAFDEAAAVIRSPFFFAADISAAGRAVAVEGSRDLIDVGLHREAVFWIVATWCRCLEVFEVDGSPDLVARFTPAFEAMLGDLGIESDHDLLMRRAETVAALEWVKALASELAPKPLG